MKTLIILSAFLLVLSSCTKEMPCPDPDPVYTPDPDPVTDDPSDPDDPYDPSDPGDPGDPSDPGDPGNTGPCGAGIHPGHTITWAAATKIH